MAHSLLFILSLLHSHLGLPSIPFGIKMFFLICLLILFPLLMLIFSLHTWSLTRILYLIYTCTSTTQTHPVPTDKLGSLADYTKATSDAFSDRPTTTTSSPVHTISHCYSKFSSLLHLHDITHICAQVQPEGYV